MKTLCAVLLGVGILFAATSVNAAPRVYYRAYPSRIYYPPRAYYSPRAYPYVNPYVNPYGYPAYPYGYPAYPAYGFGIRIGR